MLTSFSTDLNPPSARAEMWRHAIRQFCGDGGLRTVLDSTFRAQVDYGNIGFVRLCRIVTTPVERVVRSARSRQDVFKLVLQERGSGLYEQSGRSAQLTAGQWLMYDGSLPFSLSIREPSERYVLLVPKEAISLRGIRPSAALMRTFPSHSGMGRLMRDHVRSTFEELSANNLEPSSVLADTMVQLLQQSLILNCCEQQRLVRKEVLKSKAKAFISRRLADPHLTIDEVADAVSCSKRNLHRVFQEDEQSVGEFILRLRLQSSQQALISSETAGRSISDIAMSNGFRSAAHFSHAFKQRFGVTPRDFRNSGHNRAAVG